MDGIHDMGGMHGFGRVNVEPDEPVFHAPWEGRVLAMVNACLASGVSNLDAFRHAIERLPPLTYLTAGYYGRWLAALETLVVESGLISRDELAARMNDAADEGRNRASFATGPTPVDAGQENETASRFVVGDAVRTRNIHPSGHTRLPRYARGKRGRVVSDLGIWVFPDTNAHGLGEQRQHVYSVRFDATELWGVDAEPHTAVHLDLFERYLEAEAGHE